MSSRNNVGAFEDAEPGADVEERLEDGKIAESWVGEDFAQFQQIGVLPTLAEAIQSYKESHQ